MCHLFRAGRHSKGVAVVLGETITFSFLSLSTVVRKGAVVVSRQVAARTFVYFLQMLVRSLLPAARWATRN